ncbi:ester cyclase [Streptomyces sp. NPDC058326]|uniref:ester cyclase n=1 Tax=Streptomyces sp. NPDC058326 TaxID=3346447 RepID=UPI0036E8BEAB
MTTTQEHQKNVVHRLFMEGLNGGDLSVADELMTPDFVNHGSMDDSLTGPEAFKTTIRRQRGAFSDIRYEILDTLSEGDRVAIRWVMHGVHTGEFLGVAPTHRKVEHHAMIFFRFEDGKLAERWGIVDNFALLRVLGAR